MAITVLIEYGVDYGELKLLIVGVDLVVGWLRKAYDKIFMQSDSCMMSAQSVVYDKSLKAYYEYSDLSLTSLEHHYD